MNCSLLKFQLLQKTVFLFVLIGLICQMVYSNSTPHRRQQAQFWHILLTHFDIANALAIAIDLIQPEFWI
jgi:hypothetical protein